MIDRGAEGEPRRRRRSLSLVLRWIVWGWFGGPRLPEEEDACANESSARPRNGRGARSLRKKLHGSVGAPWRWI